MTKDAKKGAGVGNAAMLQLLSSLVAAAAGKTGAKSSPKSSELDWTMIDEIGAGPDGFSDAMMKVPSLNPTTMKPTSIYGPDRIMMTDGYSKVSPLTTGTTMTMTTDGSESTTVNAVGMTDGTAKTTMMTTLWTKPS